MTTVDRPEDPLAGIPKAAGRWQAWTKPSGYQVRIMVEEQQRPQAWQWWAPIHSGGSGTLHVCDVCVVGRICRTDLQRRRFVAEHRRCGFATVYPDDNPFTEP